jgi:cysteine desulfurase family protein
MKSDGLIYLDHAATSWPKPEPVREEMVRFLTNLSANAGRSGYQASVSSARMVFETREMLASMLGVRDSRNLVFTRGATEGINLVLKGFLKQGDTVLISPMEHNSVMRPLTFLKKELDLNIEVLPADLFGRVKAGTGKPRLIVTTHVSNVNGVIQDLAMLRQAFPGTPILLDAAQSAGVIPIDVERDGIDFIACSAHKVLLGPTGIDGCYLNPAHDVAPLLQGGTGSRSEQTEHPRTRPDRYEGGTLNLHGIAGLLGALRHIRENGLLGEHKRRLAGILLEGLGGIPRVRLHSPTDGTALLAAITVEGMSSSEVSQRLEEEHGILTRPGLQCAPAAHRHLGTFPEGTVRLSPGFGTTEAHARTAVDAARKILSRT